MDKSAAAKAYFSCVLWFPAMGSGSIPSRGIQVFIRFASRHLGSDLTGD